MPKYSSRRRYARAPRRSRRYPGRMERKMFPAKDWFRRYEPRTEATNKLYGDSFLKATPDQRVNRLQGKMFGRGAYSVGKNWRKFSQSVGLAGVGRRIVGAAGDAALGLMGAGEYTTNSLINSSSSDVPMVHSEADETGAVTICRREYVTDLYASGQAFSVQSFSINPGLEETFPWLSQVAANYEEYDLEQCVYTYRSTITDIGSSTTGQCGTIIMATNYNAGAAPFDDKISMQAYDGAMSAKTTSDMLHGIECDDSKRSGSDSHYVRTGPVPFGQDIKSYDHATFQIAQANLPYAVGTALGELWVSYTVTLRKPKFAVARGLLNQQDVFVSRNETTLLPFGNITGLLTGSANSIGCTLTLTASGGAGGAGYIGINFPSDYSGAVDILLQIEGLTASASLFSIPTFTGNVTGRSDMYAAGSAGDSPSWNVGTNEATAGGFHFYRYHVNVSPVTSATPNAMIISMISNRCTVAPTQSYLTITEMNPGLSYKALQVGPLALRGDQPVLVDQTGNIVAV